MAKLTGMAAIEYAERNGLTLSKYTDPTEEARDGVSVAEAREIAREDAGLVWIEVEADCESGQATGERCRDGAVKAVWWMPEHLRSSHIAAGYADIGALAGRNLAACGATKLRVCDGCAEELVDSGWACEA